VAKAKAKKKKKQNKKTRGHASATLEPRRLEEAIDANQNKP
jgi:hypothetical protein